MTALIDSYCRQYQQNICALFVCKYPELKFAALTTSDPDWFVVFVYSHIKENHEKYLLIKGKPVSSLSRKNVFRENLESQSMLILLPQGKDRTQQITSDFIKLRVEALSEAPLRVF